MMNKQKRSDFIVKNAKIYKNLIKSAKYALTSKSRNLVYQTYGGACMAFKLGAISKDEYYELNTMLVTNGINNPKVCLE